MNGDPVWYQQELDRRRQQEQRDEQMAREMAGLTVRGQDRHRARRDRQAQVQAEEVEVINNANFLQQARDTLTATYANGGNAARGLLGAWLTGAHNSDPAAPPRNPVQQAPVQQPVEVLAPRRRNHRSRHPDA